MQNTEYMVQGTDVTPRDGRVAGDFHELNVWQRTKDFTVFLYRLTDKGAFRKDISLRDQIRSTAVSIVSKIAEEWKETHPNLDKLSTPQNVLKSWINYSDLEDNVAINYNLADDYVENKNAVKVEDISIINNYEINGERNPHKSYGYLRTPEFSNHLSEFLTKDRNAFDLWLLRTKDKIINYFKKSADN